MLALAGLEDALSFVIAAEDAEPKPSPASYMAALARLRRSGVAPEGVIALEDGATGGEAARRAGVRCIVLDAPARSQIAQEKSLPPELLEMITKLTNDERTRTT